MPHWLRARISMNQFHRIVAKYLQTVFDHVSVRQLHVYKNFLVSYLEVYARL